MHRILRGGANANSGGSLLAASAVSLLARAIGERSPVVRSYYLATAFFRFEPAEIFTP